MENGRNFWSVANVTKYFMGWGFDNMVHGGIIHVEFIEWFSSSLVMVRLGVQMGAFCLARQRHFSWLQLWLELLCIWWNCGVHVGWRGHPWRWTCNLDSTTSLEVTYHQTRASASRQLLEKNLVEAIFLKSVFENNSANYRFTITKRTMLRYL